jgi:hypothetical protein
VRQLDRQVVWIGTDRFVVTVLGETVMLTCDDPPRRVVTLTLAEAASWLHDGRMQDEEPHPPGDAAAPGVTVATLTATVTSGVRPSIRGNHAH